MTKLLDAIIDILSFRWLRRWLETPEDVDEMEELKRERKKDRRE